MVASNSLNQEPVSILEKKIRYGFAGALMLLLLLGGLAYQSTIRHIGTLSQVSNAQANLIALAEIGQILSNAESLQRAYLVTGEKRYLQSRQATLQGENSLDFFLEELKQHNAASEQILQELKERIHLRLSLLDQVLAIREQDGFDAAKGALSFGRGSTEMTHVLRIVAYLEQQQKTALKSYEQDSSSHGKWMIVTFSILPILTFVFLGMMFGQIRREIANRKAAEQAQAQLMCELKAANEELTNFSYVVSHDLKAPLRAIGSLSTWLKDDFGDGLDQEGKEHLNLLIARVKRMDALINGILEYSRVGRVHEAKSAVDIADSIKASIELLDIPFNIQVKVETTMPTLRAAPIRMQQIFQNIIGNAVKYMDKTEGKINIGCIYEDNAWHFYIRDNGPGIEEKNFNKIFQLFQTLVPRDRVESTGVGLAIVKKIIEAYNGRIWVESQIGQGSSFHFTLPKQDLNHSKE